MASEEQLREFNGWLAEMARQYSTVINTMDRIDRHRVVVSWLEDATPVLSERCLAELRAVLDAELDDCRSRIPTIEQLRATSVPIVNPEDVL